MRVLFYSAVALAASIANITHAIRLEDMYEFGQLDVSGRDVTSVSGDAQPGEGAPHKEKKIGIKVGDVRLTADSGTD